VKSDSKSPLPLISQFITQSIIASVLLKVSVSFQVRFVHHDALADV
jgi:hypothetical protein